MKLKEKKLKENHSNTHHNQISESSNRKSFLFFIYFFFVIENLKSIQRKKKLYAQRNNIKMKKQT